ncbi:hypothetical protein ACFWIZ_30580 [Streptomyces sp. NPDC127044]
MLTDALRDRLTASAPARIVTVASRASLRAHTIDPSLDLTDTADFTRVGSSPRYGRSKLMDILFTQELGRRLQGAGVAVTCCCPGFNATGLRRELPLAGALERALTALPPARGRHHREARDRPRVRRQHRWLLRRQDRKAPAVP